MTTTDTAAYARLARRAAGIVDANGWTRDNFIDHSERYWHLPVRHAPCCLAGAIRIAALETAPPSGDPNATDADRIMTDPPGLAVETEAVLGDWLLDRGYLTGDDLAPGEPGAEPGAAVIAAWQDMDGRTARQITAAARAFADDIERNAP